MTEDAEQVVAPDVFVSNTAPEDLIPNREIDPPTSGLSNAEIGALLDSGVLELTAARFISPTDTKGWVPSRVDGIETFTAPDGTAYVRARPDEDADVIVSFPNTRGLFDMRLVRADESSTVRRAERKKRREERELRKRGYDV